MDANLEMFQEVFLPLLREAKARWLTYCSSTARCRAGTSLIRGTTTWRTPLAPGSRCTASASGMQFRIHYDSSHAILMGQDLRAIFQYLKDCGHAFLIKFSPQGTGDRLMRHCRLGVWQPDDAARRPRRAAHQPRRAAERVEEAGRLLRARAAVHRAPRSPHYLQNRSADCLDHQLAARELLELDLARTYLVLRHEYLKAQVQEKVLLGPILGSSLAFANALAGAGAMYALQHEVLVHVRFRCRASAGKATELKITLAKEH